MMEMSHRGKVFDGIIKEAEKDLRELMNIPDNYKVLFLQGGAHQQFSAVPMNLYKNGKAAYIVTGQWAKRAYQEASRYIDALVVASSADSRSDASNAFSIGAPGDTIGNTFSSTVIDVVINEDEKVFPMVSPGAPIEKAFDASDLESAAAR